MSGNPEKCSGTDKDGNLCLCPRFKKRKDQKDDEPAHCVNCGHFNTCHPDYEQISSTKTEGRIYHMVDRYTELFRKKPTTPKVSEGDARQEVSQAFLKAGEDGKTTRSSRTGKYKVSNRQSCPVFIGHSQRTGQENRRRGKEEPGWHNHHDTIRH